MNFLNQYFKYENGLTVTGLTRELNVFYVLNKFYTDDDNVLILANTLYESPK